jgi:hypothetical protein
MCLDDGVGIVSVPNYACFDKRLLTFTGWSIERPSPVDLAKAGFYYIGFGDSVECFYCKVRICAWEISDIPIKEHLKFSPRCLYVNFKNHFKNIRRIDNKKEINIKSYMIIVCVLFVYILYVSSGFYF